MPTSPPVVVLHSIQPLTTDVRAISDAVTVLTDASPGSVVRAGTPPPPDIEAAPSSEWVHLISGRPAATHPEVISNDEFCLERLARARHDLHLAPVTPTGLAGYLDKVLMKERLNAAGIQVPAWRTIDHVHDALTDTDPLPAVGYPVVAKPRIGANSRGVRVINNPTQWAAWVHDRAAQDDWQVEAFIAAPMCFVDALIVDGTYQPVLVGRYLGGLLPTPGVSVLGAISVPRTDPLWQRAIALGEQVAHTLGQDGRFATHLEFFDTDPRATVMEVCARAPGALVSEMARVTAGSNLETAHLRAQAGLPTPAFTDTGTHAAWISILARPDQTYLGPPPLSSTIEVHQLPAPTTTGRSVAAMALLSNTDHRELTHDVDICQHHAWHAPTKAGHPAYVS